MKQRILGIDTGTNSLGWAVVDRDNISNEYSLVKKGVIIFPEGVKYVKGEEKSKAAEKSKYKSKRKQYFRKRLRKIDVLRALLKYDMCPQLTDEELIQWRRNKKFPLNEDFLEWQRTSGINDKNPYFYRHYCLHNKLDLSIRANRFMVGRVMYHLAQRRGFLSNRIHSANDVDDGKVAKGISTLSEEMASVGFEYLGDFFYELYKTKGNLVRIRKHYTDREAHYRKEFLEICRVQGLTQDIVDTLAQALYFQRPLKSQRHSVGKCTFERGKPRCAVSHPFFEEFRMLSFINNVKIQGPNDDNLRPLFDDEKRMISPKFYRKSSPNFDFIDIAKAISKKQSFGYVKDHGDFVWKYNYRMSQGVSGCPVTAQLISAFGDNWRESIVEKYANKYKNNGTQKSSDEIIDEVWNVLYSFPDESNLVEYAKSKLGLDDDKAVQFSKIKMPQGFAALSLKAIRKILPFLRMGLPYSHSVMLANIPYILGKSNWSNDEVQKFVIDNVVGCIDCGQHTLTDTIDASIKDFLRNNFEIAPGREDSLYHPSMIETYSDAKKNEDGVYQLGSPRTSAVRNPMAMRSLHIIRKLVNALLVEKIIDNRTEVHIEYARELNDANKRKAIQKHQKNIEASRKKIREEIAKYYNSQNINCEVSDNDILKYRLWEEQNHICLYTGKNISLSDFLGTNPNFDIEHTLPRSLGGDNLMENLTLCECRYNRDVKKNQIPSQLGADYDEILPRLDVWRKRESNLSKQIDLLRTNSGMEKEKKDAIIQKRHLLSLERDYWHGKILRFDMKEIPDGFSRRQGAGIGIISKYAGLYLKSLFHNPNDRNKTNVFVIKGAMTAEFRRLWGLQSEYEKKDRTNHIHHCIDAITVACIGKYEYSKMAEYYRREEMLQRPTFDKPWNSFVEDIKNIENDTLIVNLIKDNVLKKARRRILTNDGLKMATGDSIRAQLHLDQYYGAIKQGEEIAYVIRRPLSYFREKTQLKESDFDCIVDDVVRQKILEAYREKKKAAFDAPIYMNKEKGIVINKVRCKTSIRTPLDIRRNRFLSTKEYKQNVHTINDSNYLMAIYSGQVGGKETRKAFTLNIFDVARAIQQGNGFNSLVPGRLEGLDLCYTLKIGTMVLLYENHPDEIDFSNTADLKKRLYTIIGMSAPLDSYPYGRINLRFHQEARKATDVKFKNGAYQQDEECRPGIFLLHTQFKALVEGQDFALTTLGEIKKLND